jgi:hypothetical protein
VIEALPLRTQVMFTVELLRRLPRDAGVQCFAVHPGEVTTGITRTLPAPLYRLYLAVLPRLLLTAEQGAALSPSARGHDLSHSDGP